MINPLVSIIVPVYNVEKVLKRCLESIINQSYSNIEIILVNDGSDDSSGKICNKYANCYENIYLLNKTNAGVSSARNAGVEFSKGEYIQFVDSDDWIDPDYTKNLLMALLESNADFVIGGYKVIQADTLNVQNIIFYNKVFDEQFFCEIYNDIFPMFLIHSPCNKIYIKEILTKHNIKFNTKLSLGEDLIFNNEYIRYISKITLIKDTGYNYLINNKSSLTNKYYSNLPELYDEQYKSVKKLIESKGKNINLLEQINEIFVQNIRNSVAQVNNKKFEKRKMYQYLKNLKKLSFYKSQKYVKNRLIVDYILQTRSTLLLFSYLKLRGKIRRGK